MRGTQPEKMPVSQVRDVVELMCQRGGEVAPSGVRQWPKSRCVAWLRQSGVLDHGIGNFCRDLLRVVVGYTDDGNRYPIGLSYVRMAELVRLWFPGSVADERHLVWYASAMRADDEMIPVYRDK